MVAKSGAWPAKWVDSGEPTAREGFVPQAHFDAGTGLRLYKKTRAPSTLRPWPEKRKKESLIPLHRLLHLYSICQEAVLLQELF